MSDEMMSEDERVVYRHFVLDREGQEHAIIEDALAPTGWCCESCGDSVIFLPSSSRFWDRVEALENDG